MVVFPALSSPSTRIRASLSPKNCVNSLDKNIPILSPSSRPPPQRQKQLTLRYRPDPRSRSDFSQPHLCNRLPIYSYKELPIQRKPARMRRSIASQDSAKADLNRTRPRNLLRPNLILRQKRTSEFADSTSIKLPSKFHDICLKYRTRTRQSLQRDRDQIGSKPVESIVGAQFSILSERKLLPPEQTLEAY